MYRSLAICVCAVLLAACSTDLSPGGQSVTLYRGDSVNLVSGCKHVGTVHSSSRDSMGDVYHGLRNKAAVMGGNSVAVINRGVGMGGFYATGAVYTCQ